MNDRPGSRYVAEHRRGARRTAWHAAWACVPHPRLRAPEPCRARRGMGLTVNHSGISPDDKTRPKIKSLLLSEVPALPLASASGLCPPRARPVPSVSLSLTLFSPGPQTKHRRCKRISRNRRPRLARAGPSPGPIAVVLDGPSPSARTPLYGRPLDDESNLGWPSRVNRHASTVSHVLRIPAYGPPRIRGDRCVGAIHCVYTAYDSLVVEGSDITGGVSRSNLSFFGWLSRVWL